MFRLHLRILLYCFETSPLVVVIGTNFGILVYVWHLVLCLCTCVARTRNGALGRTPGAGTDACPRDGPLSSGQTPVLGMDTCCRDRNGPGAEEGRSDDAPDGGPVQIFWPKLGIRQPRPGITPLRRAGRCPAGGTSNNLADNNICYTVSLLRVDTTPYYHETSWNEQ